MVKHWYKEKNSAGLKSQGGIVGEKNSIIVVASRIPLHLRVRRNVFRSDTQIRRR